MLPPEELGVDAAPGSAQDVHQSGQGRCFQHGDQALRHAIATAGQIDRGSDLGEVQVRCSTKAPAHWTPTPRRILGTEPGLPALTEVLPFLAQGVRQNGRGSVRLRFHDAREAAPHALRVAIAHHPRIRERRAADGNEPHPRGARGPQSAVHPLAPGEVRQVATGARCHEANLCERDRPPPRAF